MIREYENYQPYSWHQSHDQATILVYVPHETEDNDVDVKFERNYLVAGVKGKAPVVKGRLYGAIDMAHSMWQLETRASRFSARERTTSTTSTASTHSSFAVVSETEISSSFAASLEAGFVSDFDESLSSPALSSPVSLAADDFSSLPLRTDSRRRGRFTTSHPVSPQRTHGLSSLTSSASSMESLHTGNSRLLTIHLEKADSMIWPSLIVGPALESLSPCNAASYPWTTPSVVEVRYNMDPTSLVLLGLELCDIREEEEEAFEFFARAWHQAHVPSATIRLACHYLPLHAVPPELLSASVQTPSTPTNCRQTTLSPDTTPNTSHVTPPYIESISPMKGTMSYYLDRIGGPSNLAILYLESGLLYLEGSAASLLASSYSGLSSLRTPLAASHLSAHPDHGGSDAWNSDQAHARRFFNRARELRPALDVPLLPASNPSSEPESGDNESPVLGSDHETAQTRTRLPAVEVDETSEKKPRRRRRRDTVVGDDLAASVTSRSAVEDPLDGPGEDNTWYLYLPGLVGAGTALLVVGFLSFSSWRKGQGN
ncbi:hypothetical protein PHLGIDRAFT_129136 [Phlebiopsis gigantea 11061_1 CR5-6]|uniref:CS domain-containing protein n=1 Tax=Phlebiopsis gigantea (strain 11061_1 CR5-6) TaxID=745531 RepID=A0A0C3S814_PHLG1|nr:hypothetical protein PHLGIDRAFT_129136 [Phlebiopsis gigantea 11061_1 CR5-6]